MMTVLIIAIAVAVLCGRMGRHGWRRSSGMMMAGPFGRRGLRGLRRLRRLESGLAGPAVIIQVGRDADERQGAGTADVTGRGESRSRVRTGARGETPPAAPGSTSPGQVPPQRFETPLEVLQRRFAAGELGIDEYEREVGRLYGVKEK